jgi:nicotinamide-nucleotide amidase
MDPLVALRDRGEVVATAESLTGGMLASRITDVPGASRFFAGGVVAYATPAKQAVLGVDATLIHEHGVVSGPCAEAMAHGVRLLFGATWGLATTGVAGPDGQEGHPPGTVWIAVAGPGSTVSQRLALTGSRQEIRDQTCTATLGLLLSTLREEETGLR